METLEKLMLEKIVVKMKRFKMNEIQQLFKILHLKMEWKDIVDIVTECRMRMNVANVVSVVHELLKNSESSIEATYHQVLLVDAIFHQSSNWWTVSIDKANKRLLDKEIIRNNIHTMLDKLSIDATTYVMKNNQLFWVLINENSKNDGSGACAKLSIPFFFTIVPGKVFHVFHRPQNFNNVLMKVVIKSVGATKCKPYALSGKHLPSMVSLLADKCNERKLKDAALRELTNNYRDEDVQEYVQTLFGNECRVLERFTLNVLTDLSVSNNNTTGNGGKKSKRRTFKTTIELKGDNVMDGIKDMMLTSVLQPAYPDWVRRLPISGKNCFNIDLVSP